MKWFESLVVLLVPTLEIENPQWQQKWEQTQQQQFLRYASFFFGVVAIGYMANYFFFDLPMGLEPTEFWFRFRASIAAIAAACVGFYLSPMSKWKYYKFPAIIACFIITYTQAKVAVWFNLDAWIFFYVFVITGVVFLGMNLLWSLLFTLALTISGAPILLEAGLSDEYVISSTLVALVVTIIVRRTAVTEIRNFLLSEQNMESQMQITQMSNEFADRVKSFIPRVIADRISNSIENQRLSVVEASIEALKARKKNIACLFTDIRGYTQGSKDLDEFIVESVLPEVTACSNAIEELSGIPRKVGDLIFAYWDEDSVHANILRAINAGIEVARMNETMNATSSQMAIKRYILISCGEAMVGNFGSLDSSVEITALGTPVNFLSRVDDVTKNVEVASQLESGDLILSEDVVDNVRSLGIELPFEPIELHAQGLKLRDFPETSRLFKLTPTTETLELIAAILENTVGPND